MKSFLSVAIIIILSAAQAAQAGWGGGIRDLFKHFAKGADRTATVIGGAKDVGDAIKNKKESSKLERENERLQEENKKLTREKEEQDRRDTFKYCRQCSINGNENLDEPLNDEIKSQ